MAEERKYCEDCRFFQEGSTLSNSRCLFSPRKDAALSLVSRSYEPALRWCDIERGSDAGDRCGPEAQWFEPKPSIQEAAE